VDNPNLKGFQYSAKIWLSTYRNALKGGVWCATIGHKPLSFRLIPSGAMMDTPESAWIVPSALLRLGGTLYFHRENITLDVLGTPAPEPQQKVAPITAPKIGTASKAAGAPGNPDLSGKSAIMCSFSGAAGNYSA
jgi:hypothetical protein